MKRTGPTNPQLNVLISDLQKLSATENVNIWSRVAKDLSRPARIRRETNLHSISRNTSKDDVIVVPGKVLSDGELKHNIIVAAFKFSNSAKEKITKAGGKAIEIAQLMKDNPKGSKVKIIG